MGVMILQHRILNMRDFKVRENENGNPVIEGYFAKFNEFYEVCKGWKEKISPGAFRNYLQSGGEIKVLWNHNSDIVMGSRSNGTALFREDEIGLWASVEINPKDSASMDGVARIDRRDVTGCSFGFDIEQLETTYEDDGTIVDDIKSVFPLYEVSPCTFPAYEGTEIYKRNAEQRDEQLKKFKERSFAAWKSKIAEKLNKIKGV